MTGSFCPPVWGQSTLITWSITPPTMIMTRWTSQSSPKAEPVTSMSAGMPPTSSTIRYLWAAEDEHLKSILNSIGFNPLALRQHFRAKMSVQANDIDDHFTEAQNQHPGSNSNVSRPTDLDEESFMANHANARDRRREQQAARTPRARQRVYPEWFSNSRRDHRSTGARDPWDPSHTPTQPAAAYTPPAPSVPPPIAPLRLSPPSSNSTTFSSNPSTRTPSPSRRPTSPPITPPHLLSPADYLPLPSPTLRATTPPSFHSTRHSPTAHSRSLNLHINTQSNLPPTLHQSFVNTVSHLTTTLRSLFALYSLTPGHTILTPTEQATHTRLYTTIFTYRARLIQDMRDLEGVWADVNSLTDAAEERAEEYRVQREWSWRVRASRRASGLPEATEHNSEHQSEQPSQEY